VNRRGSGRRRRRRRRRKKKKKRRHDDAHQTLGIQVEATNCSSSVHPFGVIAVPRSG